MPKHPATQLRGVHEIKRPPVQAELSFNRGNEVIEHYIGWLKRISNWSENGTIIVNLPIGTAWWLGTGG
jgi:hypothetical protein